MSLQMSLPALLKDAENRWADRLAIEDPPHGTILYRDLARLSNDLCDWLRSSGVRRGDRVGICAEKSIDAVVTILGTMKTGAAYVPVDPSAPVARNAYILNDCQVKIAFVEEHLAPNLETELRELGAACHVVRLPRVGGGNAIRTVLSQTSSGDATTPAPLVHPEPDDLAYILYTSGSTGKPKGIKLSHRNAATFVEWCSETFGHTEQDRCSSHAPLHFDLSILDLYVTLKHGATLILVDSVTGREPTKLAAFIAEHRITIWYSAPSILSMLVQFGKLSRHDYSALRMILFAGEVFPVKHLRALKEAVPHPRYFNLYGPTETNVCTYYEIPPTIPPTRTTPYPIGKVCSHLRAKVIDGSGNSLAAEAEGELCISGPAVMAGYWNLNDTADPFLEDADGTRWYRTGDVVFENDDGDYIFVGRRDRMVKRRGHRVELGEIEAGLYKHEAVKEAAVISVPDQDQGVQLIAFMSMKSTTPPSIIELKRYCADVLPAAMIPDRFHFLDVLPKTSTDKIDYQRLKDIR